MAKSKEELIYDIENELVDPTTNKVTGERVKARLLDMVATMAESAGSGGGGGAAMEYWGVPAGYESDVMADAMGELCALCVLGKFNLDGATMIVSAGLAMQFPEAVLAFTFDPNIKLVYPGMGVATAKEILAQIGVADLSAVGLTPITEEVFYTI